MIFKNVVVDSFLDTNTCNSIFAILSETVIESLCVTLFPKILWNGILYEKMQLIFLQVYKCFRKLRYTVHSNLCSTTYFFEKTRTCILINKIEVHIERIVKNPNEVIAGRPYKCSRYRVIYSIFSVLLYGQEKNMYLHTGRRQILLGLWIIKHVRSA